MKVKYIVEVDFEYPLLNADSDPYSKWRTEEYEEDMERGLQEFLESKQEQYGIDFKVTTEIIK